MKKGAKGGNKGNKNNPPRRRGRTSSYHNFSDNDNMMDDDIDSFHKQRDIIPLDVIHDTLESDEDEEHPVLNFEYDKDSEDDDDADDSDDDEMEDNMKYNSLAAKILRQQKYIRTKTGGVEDEMHDVAEDADKKKLLWSTKKNLYYNADNEVQSSDDEMVANEEEAEVVRLQKENAQSLSLDDFGLEHISEDGSDGEPTMEEMLSTEKTCARASADKVVQDDIGTAYEEINKDLNALSREEQMDVVYSSAPELVGLLSELNDSLEQLDKLNPLLTQVSQHPRKDGMHYVEVKQILLLSYCQAITFYLLLKSEGQPVRDHPIIARLVEIKNLLDKMKQLHTYFPSNIEQFLDQQSGTSTEINFSGEDAGLASNSLIEVLKLSPTLNGNKEPSLHREPVDLVKVDSSKNQKNKCRKRKLQNDLVGSQSQEMLKIRADLEEKLQKKDAFGSIPKKHDKAKKYLQMVNGKLATLDDFDDDPLDVERGSRSTSNGQANSLVLSKLSQLVNPINKPKVISGDDDLPKRDDIGERRRKHELRVLAGAGIKSVDDFENGPGTHEVDEVDDDMEQDDEMEGSEDDFYRRVEQKRAAKLAAKAKIYSRTPAVPSLPETLVDGKRQITYQIEKNKGLTPNRKKLTKNPRKKYKLKHDKAVTRRKGQVREMRKPAGPYSGEASGINAGISRSIRFKT